MVRGRCRKVPLGLAPWILSPGAIRGEAARPFGTSFAGAVARAGSVASCAAEREARLGLIGKFNRTAAWLTPVKHGARAPASPILSITFDDFPKSAWTNGRAVLQRHGALATYYVS